MKVPQNLGEWNLDLIMGLLECQAFEGMTFDFKRMLPPSGDDVGKKRLATDCAAFANTEGGFLVFGIADGRDLTPADRIVGIDATDRFAERFDPYPAKCSPPVAFSPIRTLTVSSKHVVHVIHIPKSSSGPHAVGTSDDGFRWPYRTDGGRTGYMDHAEIKKRFLMGVRELAAGRQLLAFIESTNAGCNDMRSIQGPHKYGGVGDRSVAAPPPIDSARISQLLGQGAALLLDEHSLKDLARLESELGRVNQGIRILAADLERIGDDPKEPDPGSKNSARASYDEKLDELVEDRIRAINKFKSQLDAACQEVNSLALHVTHQLRRCLESK